MNEDARRAIEARQTEIVIEIAAMKIIVEALGKLDKDTVARIVRWTASRYGVTLDDV